MISPAGWPCAVRGIQIQGKAAERADAGQRCALNLTGADLAAVRRGDWVLAAPYISRRSSIDARVQVPSRPSRIHLSMDAGSRASCDERTSRPASPPVAALLYHQRYSHRQPGARSADRRLARRSVILRDQSAPHARRRIRTGFLRSATRRSTPPRRLSSLRSSRRSQRRFGYHSLQTIARSIWRASRRCKTSRANPLPAVRSEPDRAIGKDARVGIAIRVRALCHALSLHSKNFIAENPQAVGQENEMMRKSVAPKLTRDAFTSFLRETRPTSARSKRVVLPRGSPGTNATAKRADMIDVAERESGRWKQRHSMRCRSASSPYNSS